MTVIPKSIGDYLAPSSTLILKMERGSDYALSEVASRIRGFKKDYLLQSFLRESVSKHPINFKPKTFGKKDWRAIEAKREAAKEAIGADDGRIREVKEEGDFSVPLSRLGSDYRGWVT